MLIYWKIRYLDRTTKKLNDRFLYLKTESLDAVTKAAVELAIGAKTEKDRRNFLRFRDLFKEESEAAVSEWHEGASFVTGPDVGEYFEDENGLEISKDEIGQILTGNPNVFDASGLEQHDIEFKLAESKPIPLANVSLSEADTKLLGYFCRDFKELQASAFMKNGPGTLKVQGRIDGTRSEPHVETSVTDDEIRSFVTIFRRLYMEKEPANFVKAVTVFTEALGDHPISTWVEGTSKSYETTLEKPPELRMFMAKEKCTFTTKRLLDVFIYTRYSHQPDERRQRQYQECLAELDGKAGLLTWSFFYEIWGCGLIIGNAARQIVRWFDRYCAHHNITPDVLKSLLDEHPGIGRQEKEEARKARLFEEKANELAVDQWKQAGEPAGGSSLFLVQARQQLRRALEG